MTAVEAMSGAGEGRRELGVNSEKVADIHGEPKEERYQNRGLVDTEWTHVLVTVRESAQGWIRSVLIVFLTLSTRRSLRVWAWDWPSADRLSKLTEGVYGRRQIHLTAPSFSLRCQFAMRRSREASRRQQVAPAML